MKKAKIMLGAIILFAVVGGAVAFKAKSNSFGSTVTLFSYTSSNTIPAYTAVGVAGCFKPVTVVDATTTSVPGIAVAASSTTFLTNIGLVCATLITQMDGE